MNIIDNIMALARECEFVAGDSEAYDRCRQTLRATIALALALTPGEPVAWLLRWNDDGAARTTVRLTKPDGGWTPDCLFPLYTAPQPQQWVGLTDEEIGAAYEQMSDYEMYDEFARAIEAKLREKNGGKV